MLRKVKILPLSVSSALAIAALGGCASFVITDDTLVQRTGFALGLDPSQFTISNRMDEGVTSRYQVSTTQGRQYNCFVGGSISVIGKSISEAVCTETGARATPASSGSNGGSCNALLKAAGKC